MEDNTTTFISLKENSRRYYNALQGFKSTEELRKTLGIWQAPIARSRY